MLPLYPTQQVLQGIATNLQATLTDATGEPVAGLTVTVTVTRADGTVLYTSQSATDAGSGVYTFAVTAADLSTLDYLKAVWSVGGVARATTHHEVTGRYYFSLTQARLDDMNVTGLQLSPTDFARARGTVEAVFERICRVAFVPRYRRHTVDGSTDLEIVLPDVQVRTIREVTFTYGAGSTYTLSPTELTALGLNGRAGVVAPFNSQDNVAARIFLAGVAPFGWRSVTVGYEHGFDQPPPDIRDAGYTYLRETVQRPRDSMPTRAITFTAQDGGTYRLNLPDGFHTGNPWVDAVLEGHARDETNYAF